jgi:hypothetical protein
MGPPPCHFISLPSTFPLLPCVIHSPLLFGPRGSPFFPPSAHFLPRVPFLSTSVSHPKASSFIPSSPHLPGCLPPWIISQSPLSSLTFSPLLPCAPFMPSLLPCTILHAGLLICSSRYSVIPGGSARSHPDPEVLSWLGRYQSQEAVIEAVGGG